MAQTRSRKPHRNDEFPIKQIAVIAICRLAEGIAFMSILAYSYVMVINLQNGDVTNASFYAGLLVSGFAVAETSTAMFWGALSDRYGRKPIVLTSLAGTALSSLIFGFAKSYWVAFAARVIGGLLDGNVAVMQTMMAEMVKRSEHEPRAYTIIPLMWSVASIIGPPLGGFLAQPAIYYPSLFAKDGIFGQFPYLLPNLVAVTALLAAILQGYFLLEETNPRFQAQEEDEREPYEQEEIEDQDDEEHYDILDERTPLQQNARRLSVTEIWDADPGTLSLVAGGEFALADPSLKLIESTIGSSQATTTLLPERGSQQYDRASEDDSENCKPVFNRGVIMMIIAIIIMCYHQMGFLSLLPIYLLDEPQKRDNSFDNRGGLGYSLHEVGTYMAINGVIALIIQATIFPVFVSRMGVWKSMVILTVFYPSSFIIMPFLSLLPRAVQPLGIYAIMALQNFFAIIVYPCALILLKNATTSSLVLGRVNGVAMSASSASRTLAPPLVGFIYGSLGSTAAWWSCAAIAMVAIVQLYWIPREMVDKAVVENAQRRKSTAEATMITGSD